MDTQRETDQNSKQQPRINRTYNINNLWYFELRGGGQQGPFDSREEMENALNEFIALQVEMKEKDSENN
ncbi:MAG: DUF6316 family protein [Gammaproteobacteria bacterium]